ncbi:MAG: CU044_2847 family protein [Acidobacteriota bacterium]
MKRLIEFPIEDGSTILVEVDEPEAEGTVRVARLGEIAERASQSFESALEGIRPAASAIVAKLSDLRIPPDQVGVEFGLKFGAKAGAFFASADTEANFKVTLTWKRQEQKIGS